MKKQFLIMCIVAGFASGHVYAFDHESLLKNVVSVRPGIVGAGVAIAGWFSALGYLNQAQSYSFQKNQLRDCSDRYDRQVIVPYLEGSASQRNLIGPYIVDQQITAYITTTGDGSFESRVKKSIWIRRQDESGTLSESLGFNEALGEIQQKETQAYLSLSFACAAMVVGAYLFFNY